MRYRTRASPPAPPAGAKPAPNARTVASTIAVSGNSHSRVFYIASGATVAISGLTIEQGRTVGDGTDDGSNEGGGVYNQGTLTLQSDTISGNQAIGQAGADGKARQHVSTRQNELWSDEEAGALARGALDDNDRRQRGADHIFERRCVSPGCGRGCQRRGSRGFGGGGAGRWGGVGRGGK